MFHAPTADNPPPIEVRGETLCPRPDEVAEALRRTLGGGAASAPSDVADLSDDAGALVVVVRRATGEVIGEKRVPRELGCGVRAEVAAVSIAALEARLGDGDAAALPMPPAPAAKLTPEAQTAAPTPLVKRAPVGGDVRAIVLTGGLAALVAVNGTDLSPAFRLELGVRRAASDWGLALAAAMVGAHQMAVGPGEGTWRRWGGEVAVMRTLKSWDSARIEARAGVALSALIVEGQAFPLNDGGTTLLDPGAVAGVRFVFGGGRVRGGRVLGWLELGGAFWPRAHELSVRDTSGQQTAVASIPRAELLAGVGASFGGAR